LVEYHNDERESGKVSSGLARDDSAFVKQHEELEPKSVGQAPEDEKRPDRDHPRFAARRGSPQMRRKDPDLLKMAQFLPKDASAGTANFCSTPTTLAHFFKKRYG